MTPRAILLSDTAAERFGRRMQSLAPNRPLVRVADDAVDGDLDAVEIAFFSGDVFPERVGPFIRQLVRCKELRWFHTFSAGVDNPFFAGLLERGIRLSTSSGAMATPIAHTVMLYLLALSRDLPGWLRAQAQHAWEPRPVQELSGRTLGVLGLGPIGMEVARLGAAFGMHVIGMRREPRGDEPCETWPLTRLDELLGRADDLVLALPLSDATHHILDADAIARLPKGARIVNVGRGELLDEAALADALASGHLAGAGLDVFEVEPLPEDSPLWGRPDVIVTPHSSGTTPGNQERAAEIFLENLARYGRGDPLRNEVLSP